LLEIVKLYLELTPHNTAFCPFHKEKTKSFKVYANNKFKCFGCGANGDVLDFVSAIENISLNEAIKRIDNLFNLNLFVNKIKTKKTKEEIDLINLLKIKSERLAHCKKQKEKIIKKGDDNLLNFEDCFKAYCEICREEEYYKNIKIRKNIVLYTYDEIVKMLDGSICISEQQYNEYWNNVGDYVHE
jgi:hypothetical protein